MNVNLNPSAEQKTTRRNFLKTAALAGAALMEVVDVVARVAVAPADLPVGIITAVVGAPLFLVLLLRQRRRDAVGG